VRSQQSQQENCIFAMNFFARFIKPAARSMELPRVNWGSLRTSHATWLKMAGAEVKDAQAQMRTSRSSTTLDIYRLSGTNRPILEFIPIVSVLDSQAQSCQLGSTLLSRVTSHTSSGEP
jgi:hypothetical protein